MRKGFTYIAKKRAWVCDDCRAEYPIPAQGEYRLDGVYDHVCPPEPADEK